MPPSMGKVRLVWVGGTKDQVRRRLGKPVEAAFERLRMDFRGSRDGGRKLETIDDEGVGPNCSVAG